MDGDSTTSLGNPFQGLVSLTIKNCHIRFSGTSRVSACARCLSCHWAPLRRVWLHNLYSSINIIRYFYVYIHTTTTIYKCYEVFLYMEKILLSLFQTNQSQLSQALLLYVL